MNSHPGNEENVMVFKKLAKQLTKLFAAAELPDPDGMTASIGGTAKAAGDNTLAAGTVSNKMIDKGAYSTAKGKADFTAAGQGSDPAAMAATGAQVDGADYTFIATRNKGAFGGDSVAVRSVTKYIAIDIDGWAPAGGPIQIDLASIVLKAGAIAPFSGNVASVDATASAFADNTLSATATDALAVEGQYSAVTGTAVTGIA
jgi:hypothetical protein